MSLLPFRCLWQLVTSGQSLRQERSESSLRGREAASAAACIQTSRRTRYGAQIAAVMIGTNDLGAETGCGTGEEGVTAAASGVADR